MSGTHDSENFVLKLTRDVPRLGPLLAQHVEYFDELLSHVFMGDVSRFAIAEFARCTDGGGSGCPDLLALLAALEQGFWDGDEGVQNLISVSFLENVAEEVAASPEFLSLFGPELRREIQPYLDMY